MKAGLEALTKLSKNRNYILDNKFSPESRAVRAANMTAKLEKRDEVIRPYWEAGKTARQISEITCINLPAVYRHIKRLESQN